LACLLLIKIGNAGYRKLVEMNPGNEYEKQMIERILREKKIRKQKQLREGKNEKAN